MFEKGRIGVHQFTILTTLFTIGSAILIAPSGLAYDAKQDAWIAAILGLLAGLLLVILYQALGQRFPQQTLVKYCEELMGKWVGKAVGLLYFCFFFILAALVLRNLGDFISTQVLVDTPLQFTHIFFLAIVILGIRNGLETFTRTSEIFLPWVLLFFFLMFILLPTQMKVNNIMPILGYGFKPIVRASLPLIGTPYLELVVFLMILPFVNQTKKLGKAFLAGVSIGGSLIVIISLLSILVLGDDLTSVQMYPSFSLARRISIGSFLERLEVVMAGIWFITIYFKLTLCLYASAVALGEVFKLSEIRQLYIPLGMTLVVLSVVAYPNVAYFIKFASKIWLFYSGTFGLVIPLLLLGLAMIRKKRDSH
ncbi:MULTISPECIES: endospore germination permease [Paenibacillus]|uniref:Endospore germination permease n=1 Tax=Paenibacillus violae TaxID=3077234 RepID=A0ABU3RIJ2_9BACL|nr:MULTISPECIES: endospore germination permease [Paenibacillus]MDU0204096.1 endospore germination permease [Paenibacillus sp. PFR10]MEC0267446.1 endospore germination permease [Paenibacillus anseongense]